VTMPADLDTRLRMALSRSDEPRASDEVRSSVLDALPRYRARRRRRVLESAAAALLAGGVSLGALLGGAGDQPAVPRSAAPLASGPSCVEVAVGSGPLRCEGSPIGAPATAHGQGTAGPALGVPAYGSIATGGRSRSLAVGNGRSVLVSLPAGALAWSSVDVVPETAAGQPVTLGVHRRSGRATALIRALAPGSYEVSALAVPACGDHSACVGPARDWSLTLVVGGPRGGHGD
jgi:hypothetical protein